MAFTIHDTGLDGASEKVSDTSLVMSPSAVVAVGKLAMLTVVWDNVDATSADDTTKLSVADSVSNTWVRAAEAQFGTVALDGVLCGCFYCVVTTQIETSSTITITSTANGTAKACALSAFNRDTAKTIAVAGKGYQRATTGDYTATVSGLTSEEHLWIGINAMENDPNQTNGQDITYAALLGPADAANWGTTGGTGDTNVGARSAYKIATGTSETYDRAAMFSADRVTILVAFREVAAGAATVWEMGWVA